MNNEIGCETLPLCALGPPLSSALAQVHPCPPLARQDRHSKASETDARGSIVAEMVCRPEKSVTFQRRGVAPRRRAASIIRLPLPAVPLLSTVVLSATGMPLRGLRARPGALLGSARLPPPPRGASSTRALHGGTTRDTGGVVALLARLHPDLMLQPLARAARARIQPAAIDPLPTLRKYPSLSSAAARRARPRSRDSDPRPRASPPSNPRPGLVGAWHDREPSFFAGRACAAQRGLSCIVFRHQGSR